MKKITFYAEDNCSRILENLCVLEGRKLSSMLNYIIINYRKEANHNLNYIEKKARIEQNQLIKDEKNSKKEKELNNNNNEVIVTVSNNNCKKNKKKSKTPNFETEENIDACVTTIDDRFSELYKSYGEIYEYALKLFPSDLRPFKAAQKFEWIDTIRKLIELDRASKNDVLRVLRHAREDEFWSTVFFSLPSIRKKTRNHDITKFSYILTQLETKAPPKNEPNEKNRAITPKPERIRDARHESLEQRIRKLSSVAEARDEWIAKIR